MLFATWNVNSIRAHERRVLAWLAAAQPDVVALQEVMCEDRAFPRQGFAALGYEVAVHGRAGNGGVALASRLPMTDVQRGVAGAVAPFDEPRLVSATINGVRVHSIYAPNGRKVGTDAHRFKLAWFQFLGHVVASEIDHFGDVLLLAALNIAPTDPDRPAFTWWNRRGDFYESDRGWRLDHALATPDLAARIVSVSVDRAARSVPGPDHAPILVVVGE
jgi:exodeoxyribonuclease III